MKIKGVLHSSTDITRMSSFSHVSFEVDFEVAFGWHRPLANGTDPLDPFRRSPHLFCNPKPHNNYFWNVHIVLMKLVMAQSWKQIRLGEHKMHSIYFSCFARKIIIKVKICVMTWLVRYIQIWWKKYIRIDACMQAVQMHLTITMHNSIINQTHMRNKS